MSSYGQLAGKHLVYYDCDLEPCTSALKKSPAWLVGAMCLTVAAAFAVGFAASSTSLFTVVRVLPKVAIQVSTPTGFATSEVKLGAWQESLPATTQEVEIVQEPQQTSALPFKWMTAAVLSLAVVPMIQLYKRWTADDSNAEEDISALEEEAHWAIAASAGDVVMQYSAQVPVKDVSGSSVGTTELCLKTAGPNSRHVIHRKLVAEFANRRQANAHTKTRGEVSGGGKKPYKQKGTGNARRGSTRSPLMRHGGVAFGPRNTKNYKQKINKKEGRLAISSLIQNRAPLITVVNDLENAMNVVSTKKAAELIDSWKDQAKGDKVLLVVDVQGQLSATHPLVLSTNNLPLVRLMTQQNLAVADLLWPHQIFMSAKAIEAIKSRFEVSEASEESDASVAV